MKLVLLKTGQVAMAAFITIILLLTSALKDVHSTCETPQFVGYGRDGPLKCKFEEDTVGLYWYELINSTYELQIKLDAVEGGDVAISGPGYVDGNFDILDDGSLMIFNVTNYNTRNFKAVHVNTNYLVTENFVELVTSILSHQGFPSVSVCDGDNICFVDSNEVSNLTCTFHQNRPAVEMTWYRQSHEGVEFIRQNPSISKDGKWTFSSVLNLDVTNLINGPLIAFICRVSSPALNSVTMESTAVIYSNEIKWQSLVQANRTETFHLINTSAEVCCSEAGRNQLLLWKELREGYSEARVLYINGMEKHLSNFSSDLRISPEGSIVVDRMKFASQGLYTCVSINDRQYYSVENEVTIQVPPTPPFIVADGCPLENKHCAISLQAVNNLLSISCTVKGVYPKLDLGMEGNYFSKDTNVITQVKRARDGQTFDVMATVVLHPQECGMVQNVTCFTNGPKRLQIVLDKTITIQTACITKHVRPVAVILPVTAVLIISICLVLFYFRRKNQKPKNFQKDDEDQPGNVIPLRKDEDDLKHTEQSRDQQMEMNDEFSGVSEISESTHLLNEEGTDTSRDDDTQPCLLRERATLSPFDESVIGILREEQFKVKDSEDMGINLRSYVDKEEWNRVKNALKKVTAWHKNLAHVIVLLHVKSCWEEDTLNTFTRGVEQLMNSLKEDSLNDITNFRSRTDALVKKLEETNSISIIQCNEHLKFLKEEQYGDNIEMFKGCLQNILGTTMFSTFRKLIETLFIADVVNYGGKFQAVDASESKTKEQRLDTNLREIMKGINFARFALDEIPPCKGSSLKDTVHLMERINLAIKQSYQNG